MNVMPRRLRRRSQTKGAMGPRTRKFTPSLAHQARWWASAAAVASVTVGGVLFVVAGAPAQASAISSGCTLAPFMSGVRPTPTQSVISTNDAFNAGETLSVAFSSAAQGATTGVLTIGPGASTTGLTNQSTQIPGALSYKFLTNSTFSISASLNAGVAIMTFKCTPDSDLALANVPANITTAATSAAGAAVSYTLPTATDDDATATVGCDHAPGSVFPLGTTTVTCTATDTDDTPSSVSATFTVTVADTDLALANVPANITTAATSAAGAAVSYTLPTATDEDATATVGCDHAPGSVFPLGTTTVTCTATDTDDTPSSVSATFTVTVADPPADPPPPSPATLLKELEGAVKGTKHGKDLAGPIEQAERDVAHGDARGACRALDTFIDAVTDVHDKEMTKARAAALVTGARHIEAVLGCSAPARDRRDDDGGKDAKRGSK